MKLTLLILGVGALGRVGMATAVQNAGGIMDGIIGKLVTELPMVGALIVLVWIGVKYSQQQQALFMGHLTEQRSDHKELQKETIKVTTEANVVSQGVKQTLGESSRALDRLDRTLQRMVQGRNIRIDDDDER